MIINVPFQGFYHTWLDSELDSQLEQIIEGYIENGETTLDKETLSDMIFNHVDWGCAQKYICEKYVEAFDARFLADCSVNLGLKFESMTSPREYNFATDRAWAEITLEAATDLYECTGDDMLEKEIKARFTSCDGFISFYSNRLEDWRAKPLEEWDYNELGTLLYAHVALDPDWDYKIFNDLGEEFYRAMDAGIDWPKFQQAVREKELELAGECEDDGQFFPLGISDTGCYVHVYCHMNHLKEE